LVRTVGTQPGDFWVLGDHVYTAAGPHTVAVQVNDVGGSQLPVAGTINVVTDPNQPFLSQVYLDLLRRPVDAFGLQYFGGLLRSGQASPTSVAAFLTTTPEYRAVQVQDMYLNLLGRPADPVGLNNLTNLLLAGGTVEQAEAVLIGSPEYFLVRGHGSNDGFVDAVYNDLFHRPADAATRAGIDQSLASGTFSRGQIAAILFNTDEYRQDLVQADFQRYLGRDAGPAGLAAFVNALKQGARDEQVVAALLGSAEFINSL
jgi:hypothetical protein